MESQLVDERLKSLTAELMASVSGELDAFKRETGVPVSTVEFRFVDVTEICDPYEKTALVGVSVAITKRTFVAGATRTERAVVRHEDA